MGKDKLKRWAELEIMDRVYQPDDKIIRSDYTIKGQWHAKVFGNANPIVLELGCGRGEYTVSMAQHIKSKNFIGVDIKGARLWRGAKTINEMDIRNAAFLRTRVEFLPQCFAPNEVEEIWITFPDPQPGNARAHKRLTHPAFLEKYFMFLKPQALLHLKSDDKPFFDYSLQTIGTYPGQCTFNTSDLYKDVTDNDILGIKTAYENRWLKEGKPICYLQYKFNTR